MPRHSDRRGGAAEGGDDAAQPGLTSTATATSGRIMGIGGGGARDGARRDDGGAKPARAEDKGCASEMERQLIDLTDLTLPDCSGQSDGDGAKAIGGGGRAQQQQQQTALTLSTGRMGNEDVSLVSGLASSSVRHHHHHPPLSSSALTQLVEIHRRNAINIICIRHLLGTAQVQMQHPIDSDSSNWLRKCVKDARNGNAPAHSPSISMTMAEAITDAAKIVAAATINGALASAATRNLDRGPSPAAEVPPPASNDDLMLMRNVLVGMLPVPGRDDIRTTNASAQQQRRLKLNAQPMWPMCRKEEGGNASAAARAMTTEPVRSEEVRAEIRWLARDLAAARSPRGRETDPKEGGHLPKEPMRKDAPSAEEIGGGHRLLPSPAESSKPEGDVAAAELSRKSRGAEFSEDGGSKADRRSNGPMGPGAPAPIRNSDIPSRPPELRPEREAAAADFSRERGAESPLRQECPAVIHGGSLRYRPPELQSERDVVGEKEPSRNSGSVESIPRSQMDNDTGEPSPSGDGCSKNVEHLLAEPIRREARSTFRDGRHLSLPVKLQSERDVAAPKFIEESVSIESIPHHVQVADNARKLSPYGDGSTVDHSQDEPIRREVPVIHVGSHLSWPSELQPKRYNIAASKFSHKCGSIEPKMEHLSDKQSLHQEAPATILHQRHLLSWPSKLQPEKCSVDPILHLQNMTNNTIECGPGVSSNVEHLSRPQETGAVHGKKVGRIRRYNEKNEAYGAWEDILISNSGPNDGYMRIDLNRGGKVGLFPKVLPREKQKSLSSAMHQCKLYRQYSRSQVFEEPRFHVLLSSNAHADAGYMYHGIKMKALPIGLVPEIEGFARDLARCYNLPQNQFNIGVDLIIYKDGDDSIGWHADNTQGESVVLCVVIDAPGEPRPVHIRPNKRAKQLADGDEEVQLYVGEGDAYDMDGIMQAGYEHSLPKKKSNKSHRFVLIFRHGDEALVPKDSGMAITEMAETKKLSFQTTTPDAGEDDLVPLLLQLRVNPPLVAFGHPKRVLEGSTYSRRVLFSTNAHRADQRGVNGNIQLGSDSIVVSRQRRDLREEDGLQWLRYTSNRKQGGGALCLSHDQRSVIRVFRSSKLKSEYAPPEFEGGRASYRYDGLYMVTDIWDSNGTPMGDCIVEIPAGGAQYTFHLERLLKTELNFFGHRNSMDVNELWEKIQLSHGRQPTVQFVSPCPKYSDTLPKLENVAAGCATRSIVDPSSNQPIKKDRVAMKVQPANHGLLPTRANDVRLLQLWKRYQDEDRLDSMSFPSFQDVNSFPVPWLSIPTLSDGCVYSQLPSPSLPNRNLPSTSRRDCTMFSLPTVTPHFRSHPLSYPSDCRPNQSHNMTNGTAFVNASPPEQGCKVEGCSSRGESKLSGYCKTHFKFYGRQSEFGGKRIAGGCCRGLKGVPAQRRCQRDGFVMYRATDCAGYCSTCHSRVHDNDTVASVLMNQVVGDCHGENVAAATGVSPQHLPSAIHLPNQPVTFVNPAKQSDIKVDNPQQFSFTTPQRIIAQAKETNGKYADERQNSATEQQEQCKKNKREEKEVLSEKGNRLQTGKGGRRRKKPKGVREAIMHNTQSDFDCNEMNLRQGRSQPKVVFKSWLRNRKDVWEKQHWQKKRKRDRYATFNGATTSNLTSLECRGKEEPCRSLAGDDCNNPEHCGPRRCDCGDKAHTEFSCGRSSYDLSLPSSGVSIIQVTKDAMEEIEIYAYAVMLMMYWQNSIQISSGANHERETFPSSSIVPTFGNQMMKRKNNGFKRERRKKALKKPLEKKLPKSTAKIGSRKARQIVKEKKQKVKNPISSGKNNRQKLLFSEPVKPIEPSRQITPRFTTSEEECMQSLTPLLEASVRVRGRRFKIMKVTVKWALILPKSKNKCQNGNGDVVNQVFGKKRKGLEVEPIPEESVECSPRRKSPRLSNVSFKASNCLMPKLRTK